MGWWSEYYNGKQLKMTYSATLVDKSLACCNSFGIFGSAKNKMWKFPSPTCPKKKVSTK